MDVDADGWWLLIAEAPAEGFDKAMEIEDARFRSIRGRFMSENPSAAASGSFGEVY